MRGEKVHRHVSALALQMRVIQIEIPVDSFPDHRSLWSDQVTLINVPRFVASKSSRFVQACISWLCFVRIIESFITWIRCFPLSRSSTIVESKPSCNDGPGPKHMLHTCHDLLGVVSILQGCVTGSSRQSFWMVKQLNIQLLIKSINCQLPN